MNSLINNEFNLLKSHKSELALLKLVRSKEYY